MFDKRVGPNKHVGWYFSKSLINMQIGTVFENPSKNTFRNKKWERKVEKA